VPKQASSNAVSIGSVLIEVMILVFDVFVLSKDQKSSEMAFTPGVFITN